MSFVLRLNLDQSLFQLPASMVLIDQNQLRMVLSPELSSFHTNKGYLCPGF